MANWRFLPEEDFLHGVAIAMRIRVADVRMVVRIYALTGVEQLLRSPVQGNVSARLMRRYGSLVPTLSKMKKLLISLVAFVAGCAFHKTPYITYAGHHDFADTAVFASVDARFPTMDARIKDVDGVKPACVQVGCPYWVRVLPGRHTLVVHCVLDPKVYIGIIEYKVVDLTAELTDMRPRHVYAARYDRIGDEVHLIVVDLGENPKYGLRLGLPGVNQKIYPVTFQ